MIEAHTRSENRFKVLVDTGTQDNLKLVLFESWLTIWCQRNCDGDWAVCQTLDRTKDYQIILTFSEAKEAIHFKLASGSLHVQERAPVLSYLLN